MPIVTGLLAAALAAVHLFAGRLRFLDVIPCSRWLSFAGGVAVANVFVHLLPELAARQPLLAEERLYLVAPAGLVVFYGIERTVKLSRGRQRSTAGEDRIGSGTFWLHVGSFCLYNVLIGYLLLHREETGWWSLLVYFVAMGLHFLTNDFGLRQDQKSLYRRTGRSPVASC